jgi:hypothetical protein
MEGLGVYYDCVKGEFVTHFGPRAMVPSPHEHWGLNYVLYEIGGAGGPKNTPINEKMTIL